MIPVLIGAAAVAAGAYALSGDDKTKTKRYVNENGDWVDVLNKQKNFRKRNTARNPSQSTQN